MKNAPIVCLSFLFALGACSSSSSTSSTSSQKDRGLEGDGEEAAVAAPDTNPDGVPYPTTNLGTVARNGTRSGNRIANFKFLGYPDANPANGLVPMSLAQFFDPEGKRYKLIHIQASGVWCTFCQQETEIVVPLASKFKEMKVVWLVSMAEGPTGGTPAKKSDLDGWIEEFNSPFPHVLDPGNANLGIFYDAAALPWNANINAQTMEILQSGTGAHTTEKQVLDELDGWIAQIDSGELSGDLK